MKSKQEETKIHIIQNCEVEKDLAQILKAHGDYQN
jgi:hypothetical protein